jgi:Arc/MetJ family transcription regulator
MTKTSLSIDREKAAAAAEILGTATLTATIDAALTEVIKARHRRWLLERIKRDGGIGPSDDELRRLREPC